MKTAERILLTSLDLFNEQGEASISSVDIALELDISPGNLYYHFKGKEIIVAALFDMYRERTQKLLSTPETDQLSLIEFFYYLLLLLESDFLFRFLFRNPTDILDKYPDIGKKFTRLMQQREKALAQQLQRFVDKGQLSFNATQQAQVQHLLMLILTQSGSFIRLSEGELSEEKMVYQSLANILFVMTPYLSLSEIEFTELYQSIHQKSLGDT